MLSKTCVHTIQAASSAPNNKETKLVCMNPARLAAWLPSLSPLRGRYCQYGLRPRRKWMGGWWPWCRQATCMLVTPATSVAGFWMAG